MFELKFHFILRLLLLCYDDHTMHYIRHVYLFIKHLCTFRSATLVLLFEFGLVSLKRVDPENRNYT